MDIVMTVAGPRAEYPLGALCSGQANALGHRHALGAVLTSAFGTQAFGEKPISGMRPRPDAVSILDPQTASAPRRWSP